MIRIPLDLTYSGGRIFSPITLAGWCVRAMLCYAFFYIFWFGRFDYLIGKSAGREIGSTQVFKMEQ